MHETTVLGDLRFLVLRSVCAAIVLGPHIRGFKACKRFHPSICGWSPRQSPLEFAPPRIYELLDSLVSCGMDKVFVLQDEKLAHNCAGKNNHVAYRLHARRDEQKIRMENTKFEECLRMLLSLDSTSQGQRDIVIDTYRHAALRAYLVRVPRLVPFAYLAAPCTPHI